MLPKILVTSASGHIGRHTVQLLLAEGYPVRAFVRRQDFRSDEMKASGAEIFVGNLNDFGEVQAALNGVSRVFHIPPFAPHLLHNTMLMCLAAQQARVDALVLLSQFNPSPNHPSMISREHWIANNVARWIPDVDVIHLNPGIFAFTYLLTTPITRKLGVLPLPYGNGANAPVSEYDIARCGATLLKNPSPYAGTSGRPTGPELLTPAEIADVLSGVFGRKVRYQPTSFKMFAKAARVMGAADFDTYNLRHYADEIANGAFALGAPTDHVEQLTGTPAERFADTAARYASDVARLAPNLGDTSTLGAMVFMARMMLTPAPKYTDLISQEGAVHLAAPLMGHENSEWQAAARERQLLLLDGPSKYLSNSRKSA